MWPIRSAQLSGPTEIFYITQIQKLRILTQKNIPPPKKKTLFFLGGGGEITRPLNPSITWADTKINLTCKSAEARLFRFLALSIIFFWNKQTNKKLINTIIAKLSVFHQEPHFPWIGSKQNYCFHPWAPE